MGSVISGQVAHRIVLGRGHIHDRLTVTSTGSVEPSAYGAVAVKAPAQLGEAHIDNQGVILGGAGMPSDDLAGNGGAGVVFAADGRIANSGTIAGGFGGLSNYVGGAGGAGIVFSGGGAFTNGGSIAGGVGGGATADMAYGREERAGRGGVGVSLAANDIGRNSGIIEGGNGGRSNYGYCGDGGVGVSLGRDAALSNQGTIIGGAGGNTRTSFQYPSITGGDGAAGISGKAGVTIVNDGIVVGGAGGFDLTYRNNVAGAGILLAGVGTLVNHGTIIGGTGAEGYVDTGGRGADGVDLSRRGDLTNTGTIVGGGGGFTYHAAGGGGGDGVLVNGGTVTNDGVIEGGPGRAAVYGTGPMGDALRFGSLGGTLVAAAGSSLDGAIGGWGRGDVVDLRTIHATSLAYEQGTLTLYGPGHVAVGTLTFDGTLTAADFALHSDLHGGTEIVYAGAMPSAQPAPAAAITGGALLPDHDRLIGAAHGLAHHFGG